MKVVLFFPKNFRRNIRFEIPQKGWGGFLWVLQVFAASKTSETSFDVWKLKTLA